MIETIKTKSIIMSFYFYGIMIVIRMEYNPPIGKQYTESIKSLNSYKKIKMNVLTALLAVFFWPRKYRTIFWLQVIVMKLSNK